MEIRLQRRYEQRRWNRIATQRVAKERSTRSVWEYANDCSNDVAAARAHVTLVGVVVLWWGMGESYWVWLAPTLLTLCRRLARRSTASNMAIIVPRNVFRGSDATLFQLLATRLGADDAPLTPRWCAARTTVKLLETCTGSIFAWPCVNLTLFEDRFGPGIRRRSASLRIERSHSRNRLERGFTLERVIRVAWFAVGPNRW